MALGGKGGWGRAAPAVAHARRGAARQAPQTLPQQQAPKRTPTRRKKNTPNEAIRTPAPPPPAKNNNRGYLDGLCRAVRDDGVNLSAYYAWSLLDNFEWTEGYRARFGLVAVDRRSRGLTRYPKLSAYWLGHHFFKHAPADVACLGGRDAGQLGGGEGRGGKHAPADVACLGGAGRRGAGRGGREERGGAGSGEGKGGEGGAGRGGERGVGPARTPGPGGGVEAAPGGSGEREGGAWAAAAGRRAGRRPPTDASLFQRWKLRAARWMNWWTSP